MESYVLELIRFLAGIGLVFRYRMVRAIFIRYVHSVHHCYQWINPMLGLFSKTTALIHNS